MKRVIWTETAEEARNLAIEHIAKERVGTAIRQFEEIARQTERLLDFPYLGHPSRIEGARELSINRTRFLVVYRVVGDYIHIFRFYHTAQKR